MKIKFDVVVVGAGLAGLITAYCLGKDGFKVAVIERGEYPGAKNVIGGVLYTPTLSRIFPDFIEEAPLERHIGKKKFCLINPESSISLDFWTKAFQEKPYNHSFTVLRAKFDPWLGKKVKEAGVVIIPETTVIDVISEKGKVLGVQTGRGDGDILGDVVVIAEGANSLVANRAGLGNVSDPKHFVNAVKEVVELPSKVIGERFNLSGGEGLAQEFVGFSQGLIYSGFVYTNKDSLSVGVGAYLNSLSEKRIKLPDVLEEFKNHPTVKPLIKDGVFRELCAHMIPEGTYHGRLCSDNLMVVGDAAGLLNPSPLFLEGTNLAMTSGVFAAEAIKMAKKKGDFSAPSLSFYLRPLRETFVIQDVLRYQKVPDFIQRNSALLAYYNRNITEAAKELFSLDEIPKKDKLKSIRKKFPFFKTSGDIVRFYRGLI